MRLLTSKAILALPTKPAQHRLQDPLERPRAQTAAQLSPILPPWMSRVVFPPKGILLLRKKERGDS